MCGHRVDDIAPWSALPARATRPTPRNCLPKREPRLSHRGVESGHMKIPHSSSRREFLVTASAAAAASVLPVSAREQAPRAAQWPIGSHTRPFTGFRASQAANPDYVLDAVKAAGFQ